MQYFGEECKSVMRPWIVLQNRFNNILLLLAWSDRFSIGNKVGKTCETEKKITFVQNGCISPNQTKNFVKPLVSYFHQSKMN